MVVILCTVPFVMVTPVDLKSAVYSVLVLINKICCLLWNSHLCQVHEPSPFEKLIIQVLVPFHSFNFVRWVTRNV